MTPARAGHGGGGRAARRPAERGRDRSPWTTASPSASALLDAGLPRGGGRRLRLAEVGAADGGLRRGPAPRAARRPARALPVLVPNRKGFERRARRRARARSRSSPPPARPSTARTSTPPSTSPSRASPSSCPRRARTGMWVRGYVSTCFGCPYEGAVDPGAGGGGGAAARRRSAATRSRSATPSAWPCPRRSTDVMGRLQRRAVPREALAVHFHDTRGTALANVLAALQEGIAIVDSSAGGLGGCPYAPGRQRQPGHRGPALHAARHGHRDRRGPRRRWRAASRALAPRLGHAAAQPLPAGLRTRSRRGLTAADERRPTPSSSSTTTPTTASCSCAGSSARASASWGRERPPGPGPRSRVDRCRSILLDVMMPGMSGIEVLQAVREDHRASELPVIMVTAKAQSEDVVEALGHGRERLRHQAHRLPGRARARAGPAPHPPAAARTTR